MKLKKKLKKNKHKNVEAKKRIFNVFNDTDNKIEGDYNKINIDKKNKKAKEYYNFVILITKFYYKNESKKNILLLL